MYNEDKKIPSPIDKLLFSKKMLKNLQREWKSAEESKTNNNTTPDGESLTKALLKKGLISKDILEELKSDWDNKRS